MLAWLKSLGQDFQRGIVTYIVVAAGLGAWLLAKLKVIGPAAYDLVNSRINICLALLLCALSYLLGLIFGKMKWKPKDEFKTLEKSLVPIGPFKWEVTVFSDKSFTISEMPYCKTHDMKLIENMMVYVCPVGRDCQSTNRFELRTMQQQVESVMEAHLRKQN